MSTSPKERRGEEKKEYEEFASRCVWWAKDKGSAVEKINGLVKTGLISEKVVAALDRIEYGLCLIDIVGTKMLGKRDADLTAKAPSWLHGVVRVVGFRSQDLETELRTMLAQGLDNETWSKWGHDRSGILKRPNAERTMKRVYLPNDERRFPKPKNSTKKPFQRLAEPWTGILAKAVSHIRTELGGIHELPEYDEESEDETEVWRKTETKKDCAVNVNYMPPIGYYPAHTDDWSHYLTLPDIDGSGHHIMTYSSAASLIFVAPAEMIKGVGAVAFIVQERDIWGMRSPKNHLTTSARYNAVHAVLNLTDSPRFSVNFRFGGFDQVFDQNILIENTAHASKSCKKKRALSALAFSNPGPRISYALSVQGEDQQDRFRKSSPHQYQRRRLSHSPKAAAAAATPTPLSLLSYSSQPLNDPHFDLDSFLDAAGAAES